MLGFTDRGARRPPMPLPGGARVCFTVDLAFEAFTRACQYRLRRVPPEQPDRYSLSFAEYGLRVGIWRLLDLLREAGVRAGAAVNGLAAERYPKTLKAVADAGHEMIGHGWTNDPGVPSEDAAAERTEIERTLASITAATGRKPAGWVSPGYATSAARLQALVEAGLLYSCDDAADDMPYVVTVGSTPHVIMPRTSFASNDLSNWFAPRHAPSTWLDAVKSQFDAIYDEARCGRPGWMELCLHAHFAGRLHAVQEVRQMIAYVLGHEGVWTATRAEFARWVLENPECHA